MDLSNKTIERMAKIYGVLDGLEEVEVEYVSSRQLANALGVTEFTIRKDISLLDVTGYGRRGYEVGSLKKKLGEKLHLDKKRKACIIGLGRLGEALLGYEKFERDGFKIIAGFDASINKLERIKTSIDVFPVDQLETIVKQRGIDLGIISVPSKEAQTIADKLAKAGIKGILNFSSVKVNVPVSIIYLEMDFTSALRFIAARFQNI